MTPLYLIAATLLTCTVVLSCSKDDPEPPKEPRNLQDSIALLKGKWQIVKDSITNTGDYYFMEGGTAFYPTAGVYQGSAADYIEFLASGGVTMHENNQHYTSTYQLLTNHQLIIDGLLVHGTGTVVTLTASAATFDWSNTSPNGGRFFKRLYVKR